MPINRYDLGDLVTVSALFTDQQDSPLDPSDVVFKVKMPDGAVTEYVYGTNYQVVRDAIGAFHVNVNAIQPGMWVYRWESGGVGQSVQEGRFVVEQSAL